MKKIFLFLSVSFILLGSSCTKSYTCQCELNQSPYTTSTVSIKAANTTDAILKCSQQTQGGTSTCAY